MPYSDIPVNISLTVFLKSLRVVSLGSNLPISLRMPSYSSFLVSLLLLSTSYLANMSSISFWCWLWLHWADRANARSRSSLFMQNQYCDRMVTHIWLYNYTTVEMHSDSQQSRQVLDPYKTIGCFVHGPVSTSKSAPFAFAAACYNSFKIYSPELAIKLVSPCFAHPIRAIQTHNEYTYVLVGEEVLKMKYHHVVRKWTLPVQSSKATKNMKAKQRQIGSMLVFQTVIVVSLGHSVYILDEKRNSSTVEDLDQQVATINLGINIMELVHPVTYINKILAFSASALVLFNPVSQKILFNYSSLLSSLMPPASQITLVEPSPLIDIVAVGINTGEIHIINLRSSKLVFTMKMKNAVTALAFSETDSFMVSADAHGNIILWDLENKKIVYRAESAMDAAIDKLFFVPGYQLITATSSKSNSVRQFRINLNDNKTLLLYRERTGSSPANPLTCFKVHSSKQITFSSQESTTFSSIYSHCNTYSLPAVLDSALPYHMVAKNYNLQLYRQRTNIGKINLHENITLGKFSISGKFAIVATKSRIIKISVPSHNKGANMGMSTVLTIACEWKINDCTDIILHKEHFVYAFCFNSIYILDFNQSTVVATLNQGNLCFSPATNLSQSLLALQNRTQQCVQVFNMRTMTLSRQYPSQETCSKLTFTPDNKYLLAACADCTIKILSIVQGNLYKTIKLERRIQDMAFTPDGGYFMTIWEGGREIGIWNNYIGKISTAHQDVESYKFETRLNYLTGDYRQTLTRASIKFEPSELTSVDEFESLLDQIPDCPVPQRYDFAELSKWMSLVYYDEIKARNSINKDNQSVPSLPFFLDFKNLSEEQQLITNKMKQEAKDKRDTERKKVDEQLRNDSHQITLSQKSNAKEYVKTWATLSKLSVAETDYQLRSYLLRPGNLRHLLKMFAHVIQHEQTANQMLINILLMRTLDISGIEVCLDQNSQSCGQLLQQIRSIIKNQEEVVERCTAICSRNL